MIDDENTITKDDVFLSIESKERSSNICLMSKAVSKYYRKLLLEKEIISILN